MSNSPGNAEVVVIGGGVTGASIAYHLVRAGCSDVLVLERHASAAGATARSAGLILSARTDTSLCALVTRTREAMVELESESEEDVGFRRVGSLRIATADSAVGGNTQQEGLQARAPVEVGAIETAQARELVPWLGATAGLRISHIPDDGYVDAYRLAAAYLAAARRRGARMRTGVEVRAARHDGERILGVDTDHGPVHCRWLVNAAGPWAIAMAGALGLTVPATPLRSHYWITAPHPEVAGEHPVVVFADAGAYTRPETGGLLIGAQERHSLSYDPATLPENMGDMDLSAAHDDDLLSAAGERLRGCMPCIDRLSFAHHIAGLSTYTPDGRFVIGGYPRLAGYLVASGCCGSGVSASGGIGQLVSDLLLERPPLVDPAPFRPDRFGAVDTGNADFHARCVAARAGKSRAGWREWQAPEA